jgi:hypothetical protein
VTYEQKEDAEEAVKQFDGANANGELDYPAHRYRNLTNGMQANLFD